MATVRIVNGVDVGIMSETRSAIERNPELGKCEFRARNRWDSGAHSATTIQDFKIGGEEDTSRYAPYVVESDEPYIIFGTSLAPNPTENLLHALATCVGTTLIYHASAQGVTIDELEIDINGDLDLRGIMGITEEVRNGFNRINMTFKIRADAPEEKIKELCELGQKRSPVFDCITNRVPVTARVEIKDAGKVREEEVSIAASV